MDIVLNTQYGEVIYDKTVILTTLDNIIKRIGDTKIIHAHYFKLNDNIVFDIKLQKNNNINFNSISSEMQRQIRFNLNIDKFIVILKN
ncbi:MAG: hypothetical protein LBS95_01405 [Mycoplasmataceae bacterium]|jgi:hypothetical protein|nr:hypothetical protein [Mycoplasmataceae bacterium]